MSYQGAAPSRVHHCRVSEREPSGVLSGLNPDSIPPESHLRNKAISSVQSNSQEALDRLEASKLLADRGWGKAPTYAAIEEEDPLDLANLEEAAEDFRQRILRLAPREPDTA
jgi:hypothetical protein